MSQIDVASSQPDSAAPGDRKRGGAADNQRRYRAIFENPFDVIAVLEAVRDAEGAIVDWRYCDANANWLRALGRPRDQLLGKTVREIMPARAAELIALYTRVLAHSRPEQYEEHGGETDLLISLFPVGPDSVVTSGVDISARIRVEAEVRRLLDVNRREREWLAAVLNSMTEEVYFADPQKRYTYANPAALHEFGHDSV
ncbi:MAG: PAS domain-containing protein, partial [Gammaproteobacteria bacterium]|nr:PAS domain-containing protein [Gammaproteobacteria bacterium]